MKLFVRTGKLGSPALLKGTEHRILKSTFVAMEAVPRTPNISLLNYRAGLKSIDHPYLPKHSTSIPPISLQWPTIMAMTKSMKEQPRPFFKKEICSLL